MAGRQLHQLDGVQLSFETVRWQLADINWQGVPSSNCTGKEGLIVHACVALDLSVAGFKPSAVDHSWLAEIILYAVGLKSDGTTGQTTGHLEVDMPRATVPSSSTCDGHTTGHWPVALFKRRDRQ